MNDINCIKLRAKKMKKKLIDNKIVKAEKGRVLEKGLDKKGV